MTQRILIAEDDVVQGAVLQAAMARRGHHAELVTTGLEALLRLRNGSYDLGILDYNIPDVNGLAAARLLHDFLAEDERPRLIAVTIAADELSQREQAAGAPTFDAVVPKQQGLPALLGVIETSLTEAEARKTAAEHKRSTAAAQQQQQPPATLYQDVPNEDLPTGDGQIHAISLTALKQALGPEWTRVALRAMTKAERIIRNALSSRDFISRSGDHSFLIWFGSNVTHRNEAVLAVAVREMRLRFLTDFGKEIFPSVCSSSWALRRLMPANDGV